jgi:hypothetical protein
MEDTYHRGVALDERKARLQTLMENFTKPPITRAERDIEHMLEHVCMVPFIKLVKDIVEELTDADDCTLEFLDNMTRFVLAAQAIKLAASDVTYAKVLEMVSFARSKDSTADRFPGANIGDDSVRRLAAWAAHTDKISTFAGKWVAIGVPHVDVVRQMYKDCWVKRCTQWLCTEASMRYCIKVLGRPGTDNSHLGSVLRGLLRRGPSMDTEGDIKKQAARSTGKEGYLEPSDPDVLAREIVHLAQCLHSVVDLQFRVLAKKASMDPTWPLVACEQVPSAEWLNKLLQPAAPTPEQAALAREQRNRFVATIKDPSSTASLKREAELGLLKMFVQSRGDFPTLLSNCMVSETLNHFVNCVQSEITSSADTLNVRQGMRRAAQTNLQKIVKVAEMSLFKK